jgi:hypothetical protein
MIRRTQGSFAVMLYRHIIVFSLFCCTFAGCLTSPSEKEEPESPTVEVDTALLDFGEELETLSFNVKVTGENTAWKLNGLIPEWCTVSVEKTETGGRVTVNVNRDSLSPGGYGTLITVVWDSGSHEVDIKATVPQASKDTGTIIIDVPLPEQKETRR